MTDPTPDNAILFIGPHHIPENPKIEGGGAGIASTLTSDNSGTPSDGPRNMDRILFADKRGYPPCRFVAPLRVSNLDNYKERLC